MSKDLSEKQVLTVLGWCEGDEDGGYYPAATSESTLIHGNSRHSSQTQTSGGLR